MGQYHPLRYQVFCGVAIFVNVLAFLLDRAGQSSLVGIWTWYVLLFAIVGAWQSGFRAMGWPSLALFSFAICHAALLNRVLTIGLASAVLCAAVAIGRYGVGLMRNATGPKEAKANPSLEAVSVSVPTGATDVRVADVLSRFGFGS